MSVVEKEITWVDSETRLPSELVTAELVLEGLTFPTSSRPTFNLSRGKALLLGLNHVPRSELSTVEFARLKHDIDSRQWQVDRAFVSLDDFVREHEEKTNPVPTDETECENAKEKLVIVEHLMEAMSKLNASYKAYTQMLEKRAGF